MKKIGYLLFIILMLFVINVKADETCDKTELARLKELAKKVEFDYNYKIVDDLAKFSITAYNLSDELKVMIIEDYYMDKYQRFYSKNSNTATIDNFIGGEKVLITIKAFVPNWCSGETLLTKTIKLPYYNFYYDEIRCSGMEDFKYCRQLIDTNINEDQFNAQYDAYLKSKMVIEEEKTEVKSNWNLLIIIGLIVGALMVLVGITALIIKRRKRNSL